MQQNNKGKTLIIALFILIVAGAVWFFTREEKESEIAIDSDFGSKIVYTTNTSQDKERFIEHCGELGGVFNECGTMCAPDADMCATVCAFTCEQIPNGEEEEEETVWERFIDGDYDFSLKYPVNDWNDYRDVSGDLSPKFNFYLKPAGVPLDLPLTHLADVSNVSVFPEGVGTEGLFGQTEDLDFDLEIEVSEDSKMYVLEDGTPFAVYIKPVNYPESWTEDGFIWMRLKIDNLEESCLDNGEEISMEDCNPLEEDHQVIRNGSVDEELWEKFKTTIKSFSFLGQTTKGEDSLLLQPEKDEAVESPLTIKGEVKGSWYFEASFPVVLTDWDGRIIAETSAQAQEEWMTEEFVPFEATLTFDQPYEEGAQDFMKKGYLILQKANASGLPENDDAYEIMLNFK